MTFGPDPGDCLVCGAPHCSCGGPGLEVVQLPARDAAAALALETPPTLGDGTDDRPFTTATYRGKKRGASRRT